MNICVSAQICSLYLLMFKFMISLDHRAMAEGSSIVNDDIRNTLDDEETCQHDAAVNDEIIEHRETSTKEP